MSRVRAIGSATPAALVTKGDGGGGNDHPEDEKDENDAKVEPKKKRTTGPGFGDASDRMERRRPAIGGVRPAQPMAATMGAGLAADGEGQVGPERQLAILEKKLKAIESGFQFMGKGHPDYERTQAEIEALQAMVESLTG